MKILCKIGIHRPMKLEQCLFIDCVTGDEVFLYRCSCGQAYMANMFSLFRVRAEHYDVRVDK